MHLVSLESLTNLQMAGLTVRWKAAKDPAIIDGRQARTVLFAQSLSGQLGMLLAAHNDDQRVHAVRSGGWTFVTLVHSAKQSYM